MFSRTLSRLASTAKIQRRTLPKRPFCRAVHCRHSGLNGFNVSLSSTISARQILSNYEGRRLFSSAASRSVVVHAAGPDRPGIVSELTNYLCEKGANVEESRMTILGADFALILLVTLDDSVSCEGLKDGVTEIFPGFVVSVRDTEKAQSEEEITKPLHISLEGPDQKGVVKAITQIFVAHGVSILNLDTHVAAAPWAGYKMFTLKTLVAIPRRIDRTAFEKDLNEMEETFNFDIRVDDPNEDISDSEDDFNSIPDRFK